MAASSTSTLPDGILLSWIPLGAGGHVVAVCGRAFEHLSAVSEGRAVQPLFHAALQVTVDGVTWVIEMAPVWADAHAERGVVREGPVGLRPLGRLRHFRYEVPCWPGGQIPDLAWAVGDPETISADRRVAARVLEVVQAVPGLTWGRDELGLGEMWNSNGLVSWLLTCVGIDAAALVPPGGGRAPGWRAGLALGGRVDGSTVR